MPAPGAKCADCLRAARGDRLRDRATVAPAPVAASGTELVTRRDAMIGAHIRDMRRPVKFSELLTIMPAEAWPDEVAQREALSNALRRLSVKKQIQQIGGGWVAA